MLVLIVSPGAVPASEGGGERQRDVPEKETEEKRGSQHERSTPPGSARVRWHRLPAAAPSGTSPPARPSPQEFRSFQRPHFITRGRASSAHPRHFKKVGDLVQASAHRANYTNGAGHSGSEHKPRFVPRSWFHYQPIGSHTCPAGPLRTTAQEAPERRCRALLPRESRRRTTTENGNGTPL